MPRNDLPVTHDTFRQAHNYGVSPPWTFFRPPLEKCVGHSLKVLHIVQKIWAPFRKLFAPLVSQAGYGPAFRRFKCF